MIDFDIELLRRGSCKPRFILVSDLDHTLVQYEDAAHVHLLEFGRVWSANFAHDSLLVYSTGRSPELFGQLWSEAPLLTPDVVICSVGTELFYRGAGGSYLPDLTWRQQLDGGGGWDRVRIAELVARGFPRLHVQPPSEQRPHKLSYHLDMGGREVPEPGAYLQQLEAALRAAGLGAALVFSGGRDVDLLAEGADKGSALAHLLGQLPPGCRPPLGCQVNGDSGNDVALFRVPGVRGCVVANAHPELREWQARRGGGGDVMLASEPCAGGILQALRHFGTLPAAAAGSARAAALSALLALGGVGAAGMGLAGAAGASGPAPGSLQCAGCTVLGSSVGYVNSADGDRAGQLAQLQAAVLAAGAGLPGWLDQFFMRQLPGRACVVGGVFCSMQAAGGGRAAGSVSCSVTMRQQEAAGGSADGPSGGGGSSWQAVHVHWHSVPAAQPVFLV